MSWFGSKLDNPRLRDFNYLKGPVHHVGGFYWPRDAERLTIVILNRMAHLIDRMERIPSGSICSAARWYALQVKGMTNLPVRAEPLIKPIYERLWKAIHTYETRVSSNFDPEDFGRVIADKVNVVLFGPPTTGHMYLGAMSEPDRQLYMWINLLWD